MRHFLEQFSNSKKNISDWPSWMRESSGVAVASLPRSSERELGVEPAQPNNTRPQPNGITT
jgi:hypothetical protein